MYLVFVCVLGAYLVLVDMVDDKVVDEMTNMVI